MSFEQLMAAYELEAWQEALPRDLYSILSDTTTALLNDSLGLGQRDALMAAREAAIEQLRETGKHTTTTKG
ncbi:MAG: hypothetical protein KME42_28245 [Tildeniella nuda ZEHNDER 1965/U140]|jgi:hypothetical protein|nr:hypothetical protein [Tildeniella nuda ZEHNDER 1965/U140]